MLLKKGADVNAKDKYGYTALILVSEKGHTEIVAMLLEKGADVNAKRNDGNTALVLASAMGHAEIMAMLLEKGADVNAKNNDGDTALLWASLAGHTKIVAVLLEKEGADVNATDNEGESALNWARKRKHIEIAVKLILAGATFGFFVGDKNAAIPILPIEEFEECTSPTCSITLETLEQIHTVRLPGASRACFNRSALQRYIINHYLTKDTLHAEDNNVFTFTNDPVNPISPGESISHDWIQTNYPRGLNYDYSMPWRLLHGVGGKRKTRRSKKFNKRGKRKTRRK